MTRRDLNKLLALAGTGLLAKSGSALELSRPPQEKGAAAPGHVQELLHEPLTCMPNPEASIVVLHLAPGQVSTPHRHTGPVFAYILEGSILNQVDPEPAKTYHAGDVFYEPPLHTHRVMKNLSATRPARVLVFQVGEQGKPFTLRGPAK